MSEDNSIAKPDPSQLKATLVYGDAGKKPNLILFQHTTNDGTFTPSCAGYPKKARFTLHNGDKVNLLSGNKDFKIVTYTLLLESQNKNSNSDKNNKQPIYMDKQGTKFIIPGDISGGLYHLYIKTEYTPSDDDVAYFVHTVKIDKIIENNGGREKQSKSNNANNENTVLETKSQKEELQSPAKINLVVQIAPINRTLPSDTVIKVQPSNYSIQSQYGNATTEFEPIPVPESGKNITLIALSVNQSHGRNMIIKTSNSFAQPILVQGNLTLETVRLNETKPADMILQMNTTNSTTSILPMILQFIPTNQSVHRIELLSANQTMISGNNSESQQTKEEITTITTPKHTEKSTKNTSESNSKGTRKTSTEHKSDNEGISTSNTLFITFTEFCCDYDGKVSVTLKNTQSGKLMGKAAFQVSDKDNNGKMTFASKNSRSGDNIVVSAEDKGPVGGRSSTTFTFDSQKHNYRMNIGLDEFGCVNCD